jgi:hypothetical protein
MLRGKSMRRTADLLAGRILWTIATAIAFPFSLGATGACGHGGVRVVLVPGLEPHSLDLESDAAEEVDRYLERAPSDADAACSYWSELQSTKAIIASYGPTSSAIDQVKTFLSLETHDWCEVASAKRKAKEAKCESAGEEEFAAVERDYRIEDYRSFVTGGWKHQTQLAAKEMEACSDYPLRERAERRVCELLFDGLVRERKLALKDSETLMSKYVERLLREAGYTVVDDQARTRNGSVPAFEVLTDIDSKTEPYRGGDGDRYGCWTTVWATGRLFLVVDLSPPSWTSSDEIALVARSERVERVRQGGLSETMDKPTFDSTCSYPDSLFEETARRLVDSFTTKVKERDLECAKLCKRDDRGVHACGHW